MIRDIGDANFRLLSGGSLGGTSVVLMSWLDDVAMDSISGDTVGIQLILPLFLEAPAFSQSICRQRFRWCRLKSG